MERADAGQAAVSLLLMLGLFLLAVLGFAVDLTNVWYHRESASAAADAACEAGALDMTASNSGLSLTATGFVQGIASDCVHSTSATMCFYANANGYSGSGLTSGQPSNAVSWTFPSSVSGVTPGTGLFPYLTVTIVENVQTYFMALLQASRVLALTTSSTCGITQVKEPAPMVVLNPILPGAFSYSGGAELQIVGGPSRGLQVNSSDPLAVLWLASGVIDLSLGGPNQTGSSVAVVGGPSAAPALGAASGYKGGTTGSWQSGVLPVSDPFGTVPAPASVKYITPSTTIFGKWVAYGVDGCPDHSGSTGNPLQACLEYGPGYYPLGITPLLNYITVIFLPGIYYMNGSLIASGSHTLRVAKPASYTATQGVMFYFFAGSLNISGCSGCSNSGVDNENATDLSCNGSAPPSGLGMPATLYGNILYGQCTANGTYYDSGGDTTDYLSASGSRGLMVFADHLNIADPVLTGSGALTFSGVLYFHSYLSSDVLSLSGGASSGTYVLGQIVADEVNLSGSGEIKLALTPSASTEMSKGSLFN